MNHLVSRSFLSRTLLCASIGMMCLSSVHVEAAQTGNNQLMTIETNEKPLDIVLQWVSRRAGVNVVCNEAEQPLVTMRLVNVTWQEAVDQIAARYDMVLEKRSERIWELSRPPRVRMQFQDAQLTVVLDALARQANINIVVSDDIDSGRRLTMNLNQVPWREALNVIVRSTGYTFIEHDYNIIRVVSKENVLKDLQTRLYPLNYTDGAEVAVSIEVALSEDGRVHHDARTNTLIITDTPDNLNSTIKLLKALDQRTREVQIDMKFVEYSTTDAERLGFTELGLDFDIEGVGNFTNTFFPFSSEGLTSTGTRTEQGPSGSGHRKSNFTFEAISTLNSTEVLQAPKLLTLNNTEATIIIGRTIRFAAQEVTAVDGVTTTALSEASTSPVSDGIKITVTPHITTDGYVSLDLNAKDELVTFEEFTVATESISLPQTATKEIITNIMVGDGNTAVIGGILTNTTTEIDRRIPLLGSIPGLGWLFRAKDDAITQRNTTMFITPTIVKLDTHDDLEAAKIRMKERLSGLDYTPEDDQEDGEIGH